LARRALRCSRQVVRMAGAAGWVFELAVGPTSGAGLQDKFHITEFLQVRADEVCCAAHSARQGGVRAHSACQTNAAVS
jgi:hypothetical protein